MNTALATKPAAFELTDDQQTAADSFYTFLLNPIETVFVLRGFSGCGKSTLVTILLDRMANFMRMARLVDPNQKSYEVALTATTNKAAENLARITGYEVVTIHSFLGLRVQTDFRTGVTSLIPKNHEVRENYLLVIDEGSIIDAQLLDLIFRRTANCKILFIGDPAQLTQVKSSSTPVFDAKFCGAALTEVVRQAAGNPIVQLSTQFRNTVNSGEWTKFTPDGHHVVHMSRDDFNEKIKQEFARPGWSYQDSKVLSWTNKCAIDYNHFIRNHVAGDPHFQVGDYAVNNSYISGGAKRNLKTDQLVEITAISEDCEEMEVLGNMFTVDDCLTFFMPKTLASKNLRIKQAKALKEIWRVAQIESDWIDLRAAWAQTINKAQGSTYDAVFIDLDDIGRCNSGDQIARMLYVGVSRARHHVYLTGDLA